MGLFDGMRVRGALVKHQRGDTDGALREYEQLYEQGIVQASYLLPYSVLLLRQGGEENYRKTKQILAKAQKALDLTREKRQQLLMNYAVADWKLGNREKAIALLEASHREAPCGLTYTTLGFLYVDAGMREKALAFNQEALDYDDSDPIILDNLAQAYYRLEGDKQKAREYFDRAHALKPEQIDTLYFLSRYDLEAGDKKAALAKLEQALEGRFSPLNYQTKEEIQAEIDRLQADPTANGA